MKKFWRFWNLQLYSLFLILFAGWLTFGERPPWTEAHQALILGLIFLGMALQLVRQELLKLEDKLLASRSSAINTSDLDQ